MMKQWLLLLIAVMCFSLAGCAPKKNSPVEPDTAPAPTSTSTPPSLPTVGIVATATATSITMIGSTATATPIVTPLPTPTPGPTYSVTYEVISTNCASINITYLDSNTTSHSQSVPGNTTWTSPICTISPGYETQIIGSYYGAITGTPTLTLNIYVNEVLQGTQSLTGVGAAITASYWLP